MHKIIIISAGPGNADYITLQAKKKVKECEVIIGNDAQLASTEPSLKQKIHKETNIEAIMALLKEYEGRRVGLMVTGDAGVYSLAKKVTEEFGKDAIEEIVPGVSSIQVAFARLKEPWLNVRVFSYHERPLNELEEVLKYDRVAILCDSEHNSQFILTKLENLGLFDKERNIFICQDLTTENERVVEICNSIDIKELKTGRREIIVIYH